MHLKQLIATRTQLQFSSPCPAIDNLKPKRQTPSRVSLNSWRPWQRPSSRSSDSPRQTPTKNGSMAGAGDAPRWLCKQAQPNP